VSDRQLKWVEIAVWTVAAIAILLVIGFYLGGHT
jgi:hypothetical protein